MTAEIAIMNKEAIALASDSAVTMTTESGQKIFTSANKLFALSKYRPIGIMVYGNALFMDVPWETIIKIYRNKLGKKKFDTLKEYANSFIEFLDHGNSLFPDTVQEVYIQSSISAYFKFIKDRIIKKIHSIIDERRKVSEQETKQIVSSIIKEDYERWEKANNIQSIPKSFNKNIVNKNRRIIKKEMEKTFEKLPISKSNSNQLRKITGSLFSKFPEGIYKGDISGVVIAGFGESDSFPLLESFHIEGIANNRLKYKKHMSGEISFKTSAAIIPFAQSEMVATFMEGVDPFYRDIEESYLAQIFDEYPGIIVKNLKKYTEKESDKLRKELLRINKEILADHREKLEEYRKINYIIPVTRVVSMLPKGELAEMAESLVSLTSFKRKVSMERETVAEPIDVAVISRGDGFIWIKRKHYFKAELNPRFFVSYYKEV